MKMGRSLEDRRKLPRALDHVRDAAALATRPYGVAFLLAATTNVAKRQLMFRELSQSADATGIPIHEDLRSHDSPRPLAAGIDRNSHAEQLYGTSFVSATATIERDY